MEVKPKLKKEELLDWLFSDSDDAKQLGVRIIRQLHDTGSATITIQELFDECGYIPVTLTNAKGYNEDHEFEPNEVELID
jgi:hypothetical protein